MGSPIPRHKTQETAMSLPAPFPEIAERVNNWGRWGSTTSAGRST